MGRSWKRAPVLWPVVLLLIASGAAESQTVVFRPRVDFRTLRNGLSVCLVPLDSPGIVSYWTVVRAGSRNEVEPGRTGYAHLFEHLMFRGTENFPQQKFNDEMSRMGADHNAFTDVDWTVYTATIPTTELARMIEIQADRFQNLTYGEEEHVQETGAVLGEFNIGKANPGNVLYEKLYETAYDRHTYRHTVMGWEDDVRNMPEGYDYGLKFFDLYYRPNNCCIFVVGDFEPSTALSLILKHYQRWGPGPEPPAPEQEPPQTEARRAEVRWPASTNPRVVVGFRVPAFDPKAPDAPVMEVLGEIAFGRTSPFHRRWMEETTKARSVEIEIPRTADPGLLTVEVILKDAADLEAARSDILKTMADLAGQALPQDAVDRAKSHLEHSQLARLETASSVAYTLGEMYSLSGAPLSIHNYFYSLQSMTAEQVQLFAKEHLVEGNSTTVTLVSEEEGS